MAFFSRIRGFFSGRHGASVVMRPITLVNERTESQPGHFVFPGTDFVDHIEVDGQRVGHIDYSINPLRDRLYINMIELRPGSQRSGKALARPSSGTCGNCTGCPSCRCTNTPRRKASGAWHVRASAQQV
ncbi:MULTISPECIES: hypothetical protein [Pseudomonas syringae group]|uniref:Uncharacterized protein n=2 Tax=Pseudomonas syringae group TaxID=136849 RepID=A0AAW4DXB6_PSESX|nr:MULTISPECIES: hypothetical protein [Pseudomonas syringae group]AVI83926.1 hypothetical protein XJ28_09480 [Pseudomonas syringae pv. tomato]KGK92405.1 hypothetical protein NB04_26870 [Pseudomonas syringae pv. tomato]KUR43880.1 hypothetical protein PST407_04647 [Pseudomonas syringae pv. tomato]KUR48109.1 hypothetical protein PSTA9_01257 [Pseudomonas syringae pv. tomato]MBH0138335.1 hypothetical protein [Pseudomonas syringae pv. tomato]